MINFAFLMGGFAIGCIIFKLVMGGYYGAALCVIATIVIIVGE